MKSLARTPLAAARPMKQRGSALFFALISLVAIMLAARAPVVAITT